jgi:hypothetical protein
MVMLLIGFALVLATLVGAISGALTARWMLRCAERRKDSASHEPDPTLAADIEQAAVAWSSSIGRPEAASLVADKLHLIQRIGRRRRWWR